MWEGETRYENATWREICENRRSGGKGSGVTHQRVGVTCGEEGHMCDTYVRDTHMCCETHVFLRCMFVCDKCVAQSATREWVCRQGGRIMILYTYIYMYDMM